MEEEKKELLESAAGVTGVTKPGAYTSQWQGQLSDAIGKILDRKEFSYDVNSDALYQQYKDRYVQGGKMAMMDTLGQAATLTGGYGNSYAQAAGQQAYQGYLQGLNDKIPELYQLALDKYSRESEGLYKRYSVLSAQEGQDYGRHQDSLNRYQQSWENAFRLYEAGVETPEVLGILGIPEETGDDGGSGSSGGRRGGSGGGNDGSGGDDGSELDIRHIRSEYLNKNNGISMAAKNAILYSAVANNVITAKDAMHIKNAAKSNSLKDTGGSTKYSRKQDR